MKAQLKDLDMVKTDFITLPHEAKQIKRCYSYYAGPHYQGTNCVYQGRPYHTYTTCDCKELGRMARLEYIGGGKAMGNNPEWLITEDLPGQHHQFRVWHRTFVYNRQSNGS